jgi:elongation factor P
MAKPSELKNGMIVRMDGELHSVLEIIHRTPGNLRAFYQAKFKNMRNGRQSEYRFRVDEDVETVRVEGRMFQFLYREGGELVCMDNESFDQVTISEDLFADNSARFLKENMEVQIYFEEDTPLKAEAPTFVELEVTYTEPAVRGDTVNNVMKAATVETGTDIKVPIFVNTGDKLKIDTRTGEYVSRV